MLPRFHINVDQDIIVPFGYKYKTEFNDRPPYDLTLPRHKEERKRLKWIFRGVSINNYEIISIITS